MTNRVNLVLLYGGNSGEHEISLVSAASVLQRLDASRYNIIPIGIDKQGRCYQNDYHELLSYKKSLPVVTKCSKSLASLLIDGHFSVPADVVFPVVHGPLYEDGALQGLLSLAGVAFVGCGVLASAIGMDKEMARRVLNVANVRTIPGRCLSSRASQEEKAHFCQQVSDEYGWPLFVKPLALGSSVGIHKVYNLSELDNAINDACRYDEAAIVEAYIPGREIELAVLENVSSGVPEVSLPGEICVQHPDGYYSYAAKYLDTHQTTLQAPAQLDDDTVAYLQKTAAAIFTLLGCKGLARVDFLVHEKTGEAYFNEVNTLPGFTPISMYPKLWEVSGLPYAELLDRLVDIAIKHHQRRAQLVTSYQ